MGFENQMVYSLENERMLTVKRGARTEKERQDCLTEPLFFKGYVSLRWSKHIKNGSIIWWRFHLHLCEFSECHGVCICFDSNVFVLLSDKSVNMINLLFYAFMLDSKHAKNAKVLLKSTCLHFSLCVSLCFRSCMHRTRMNTTNCMIWTVLPEILPEVSPFLLPTCAHLHVLCSP